MAATSDHPQRRPRHINGNGKPRSNNGNTYRQQQRPRFIGEDDEARESTSSGPVLLPQDVQAERALIGSVMINADVLASVLYVKPQYFFHEPHKVIWRTMLELHAAGSEIDPITLLDAVRADGRLNDIGGEEIIYGLGNDVPHAGHAQAYARIIAKKYASRFLIKASGELAGVGYRGDEEEMATAWMLSNLEVQDVFTALGIGAEGNKARFAFMTDEEVEALPDPNWLIHEVLVEDSVSVAFGDYGSGKSFLALDWALSIATGFPWMDHIVKRGLVAYIAGEGISGMKRRIRAWKKHHRWTSGPTGLHLLGTAPQLLHPEDVQALLVALRALPDTPVMVVIDTLARSMVGGDENTALDMGIAVAAAETIRAEFGCHVLVVHHKPAGISKTRGSTALPGAAQTVIDVTKEGDIMTLKCPKQKDYREFEPMKYRLHQVNLDERNHENNSLVLVPITAFDGEEDSGPVKLTKAAENVLDILRKQPGHAAQTSVLINEMAKPPYRMVKGSTINGLHNLEDARLAENTGTMWRLLE